MHGLGAVCRPVAVTGTHVVFAVVVTVALRLLSAGSGASPHLVLLCARPRLGLRGAACSLAQALQLVDCLGNKRVGKGGLGGEPSICFPLHTFLKE